MKPLNHRVGFLTVSLPVVSRANQIFCRQVSVSENCQNIGFRDIESAASISCVVSTATPSDEKSRPLLYFDFYTSDRV